MSVYQAARAGLKNFSLLVSHVLCTGYGSHPGFVNCVQAFLAAGHVCTVMGFEEYCDCGKYRVPMCNGFERGYFAGNSDVCRAASSRTLQGGESIQRSVRREGNQPRRSFCMKFFDGSAQMARCRRNPAKRLGLSEAYAAFDAEQKFGVAARASRVG